jgi:5-methylcytosine-specific restriction enzyme subunit McrC
MTTAIPIRNLYYLYAYAWDQFHFVHRVRTGEESGPDAAPFFAKILLQGCRQIFRRGVDRAYQTFDEELSLLRGRINLTKTFRRGSLDKARVWCEYDELRHDGLQNRLIKATLKRLREHPQVPSKLKAEIATVVRTFGTLGVTDIVIKSQDFRRVQLHRNNAFYGFLLHICELVHQGLFPEQAGSAGPFASLLEDETRMNRIFERFIRNFFRQEQNELDVSSERIEWDMSDEGGVALELLPSMQTDVSLRSPKRTVLIDAKYYAQTLHTHHDKERLRSAHLYQLFAYLKNMERRSEPDRRAEGILLYPTVKEEVRFSATIQGHRVSARTIDLAKPWKEIHSCLLSILDQSLPPPALNYGPHQ